MSTNLCFFSGNVLHFTGTPEEFKRMLWLDYVKTGHWFVLEGVTVMSRKPRGKIWRKSPELQEVCDKALTYGREHVPHADTRARPKKEKAMEPGDYVVPFGKWKGEKLSELPVDSLWWLLQWKEMYAGPRKRIEAYVEWLRANPERGWLTFGKYAGQELSEVPTHYLDWMLGWDKFDSPLLKELIGRTIDARCAYGTTYYADPANGVVIGVLVDLAAEKFDTQPMVPSDEYDAKLWPSGWYISRKFDTVTDELLNDGHSRKEPVRFMEKGKYGSTWWFTAETQVTYAEPIPAARSKEDRAAYPVMYAQMTVVTEEGETVKRSRPRAPDADRERVEHWRFVLECVDKLEYAGEEDLEDAYAIAKEAVANLEECEGIQAAALDVHGAYQRRKDTLDSGEVIEEVETSRRKRVCYLEKFKADVELCELGRRARGCESVAAFEELTAGLDEGTVKKLYRAYYGAGLHQAPMKG